MPWFLQVPWSLYQVLGCMMKWSLGCLVTVHFGESFYLCWAVSKGPLGIICHSLGFLHWIVRRMGQVSILGRLWVKGILPQELLWLLGMHLKVVLDDCRVISPGNDAFGCIFEGEKCIFARECALSGDCFLSLGTVISVLWALDLLFCHFLCCFFRGI